jgi:hypothetical protein
VRWAERGVGRGRGEGARGVRGAHEAGWGDGWGGGAVMGRRWGGGRGVAERGWWGWITLTSYAFVVMYWPWRL